MLSKPKALSRGDKVAVVSLSSGMLGDDFCAHEQEIGSKRLREMGLEPLFMPNALRGSEYLDAHPEARAADLKAAFADDSIKGIICAIGGCDTYRLAPYLFDDPEFAALVKEKPKLFTGFSDTTVDHLMLRKLGLETFYGPCFICDIAELADEMLPYTHDSFMSYFSNEKTRVIKPSDIWYEERTDFSAAAVGTERISHSETRGYEIICGENKVFSGRLLGGCIESLYETVFKPRFPDQKEVSDKYNIFPSLDEWRGKIIFLETSEEQPSPDYFRSMLRDFAEMGIFGVVSGVIAGKPMNEKYYDEYKAAYREIVAPYGIPVLFNVNFGHACPRCVLPYGAFAEVDAAAQEIRITEQALL